MHHFVRTKSMRAKYILVGTMTPTNMLLILFALSANIGQSVILWSSSRKDRRIYDDVRGEFVKTLAVLNAISTIVVLAMSLVYQTEAARTRFMLSWGAIQWVFFCILLVGRRSVEK